MFKYILLGAALLAIIAPCLGLFLIPLPRETGDRTDRPWTSVPGHISIVVHNNSDARIEITFWSDFGKPFRFYGLFKGGEHRVETRDGKPIPASTMVFWRKLGSNQEQHQEIDLREIPKNLTSGIILFELDHADKRTVTYESEYESAVTRAIESSEGACEGEE
jgi:hypothetical protein